MSHTGPQMRRAQAHATASEELQPRGQYPALLARIEQLERAVDRLAGLVEQMFREQS